MAAKKKKNKVKPGTNYPEGTTWMIRFTSGENAGLFSDGDNYLPSPSGRYRPPHIWTRHSSLKAHLTMVDKAHEDRVKWGDGDGVDDDGVVDNGEEEHPYKNAEIVQFIRIEQHAMPVTDYEK